MYISTYMYITISIYISIHTEIERDSPPKNVRVSVKDSKQELRRQIREILNATWTRHAMQVVASFFVHSLDFECILSSARRAFHREVDALKRRISKENWDTAQRAS